MNIKRLPAKILKWLGKILLSLVIFILLLVVAIYLPPVQQWLKGLAEDYLSKETGMEVKIEKVRLSPWLDLEVDNMSAVDKGDTVVAARELLLDIKLLPLFKGQVDLNGFELREAKLNTKDFISDTHVEGQFRLLKMDIPAVCDLKQKHVDVNRVRLKGADMRIVLSDTAAVDTTPSEPVEWRLALGELKVEDTKFDISLQTSNLKPQTSNLKPQTSNLKPQTSNLSPPGILQEYMRLKGDVQSLSLKQADINLKDDEYKAGEVTLQARDVSYDVPYEKPVKGLDTNHLLLPELNLNARNFSYGKKGIDVDLHRLALKEKSGLELTNMSGALHYDSTLVSLSNGRIETPNSQLNADVEIGDNDRMTVKVKGDVGKKDIMLLGGDALGDFGKQLPDKPLNINMRAMGTMDDLDIDYCHLNIPGNMEMRLSGRLNQISSDRRRNGRLHYDVSLKDASFLRRMMPKDLQSTLRIPNGTRIGGDVDFRGSLFNLNKNTIYSGKGSLSFTGKFDANSMAYNGRLTARQFPFQNFLPGSGLSTMSGEFNISGKGTDFLSSGTTLNIDANLDNFSYEGLPLDNIHLKAQLNGNNAEGTINANNSWLKANLDFTASQQNGRLSGSLDGSIYRLSLKPFGIGKDDMFYMADVHLKGFYEEKNQKMALGGTIDHLNAVDSRLGYPGGAINFGLGTSPDSTHIFFSSGDMTLKARAEEPFAQLISDLSNVADELTTKFTAAQLDHNALRQLLPNMRLHLNAGNDNPLHQVLLMNGYSFDTLRADITTNTATGINADVMITNVRTGAVVFEDSRLTVVQDSDAIHLNAHIENSSKKNPNRFKANLDGSLLSDGFQLMANFKDDKGREGINMGTRVKLDGRGGMSFTLIPEVSTLAYRHFKVNPDNYLRLDSAGYFYANIDLLADDHTNIKLFSIAQGDSLNHEPNQDITLSLANINLRDISNVVPFMPSMGGWLDGDIHVIKTPQSFTAVGQLQSRKLEFDGLYIGELGTELFYMPEEDGHYVVAQILSDDKEVAVLDGHYYERQGGTLDASLNLDRFPTMLLNTFLSDDGTIALQGWANGEITVKGPTNQLTLNGLLKPDSVHVYSELYGFDLTMENKDIAINNGKILFDQMKLLGHQSQNPLFIDGSVDFGDLSNIIYDLTIKAKDFELINAQKTKKTLLYGKVYVDMDATLKGRSGFMMLRGDLNVLGKTDVAYIMRDGPLQVDDQFSGLVEFVDFSDEGSEEEEQTDRGGLFVNLNLHVDEATHLHCDLSEDGKSYVDCQGGGNLTMRMFPAGDMSMEGRYNINGGEMKYTLPFIPLKTFTFAEGNYILFNGDIDNPILNITATERTKAAVTGDNDVSRMVVFDVGVKLSKSLSNMGIEFLIDAPEDSEVQIELATMGVEAKNKAAITMLATGLYMSSGNKAGFKANNALNSFLESQIQGIAGDALKTIDISVGVEGNTTATGETQTDYTFQFSKKFWNDRVTFVIGGKVTTGAEDNTSSSQSFIDNISLEYRLNRFGTRYIQVFYDNDTHDPFEGNYSSAGAGYIWRSKTQHFGDLLLFKRKKKVAKQIKEAETQESENEN